MHRAELAGVNRQAVAARIRALVSNTDSLRTAAKRLGIDAHQLEAATDRHAPYPGLEVLEAVVRVLGVDPCWLVTGRYDPAMHRRALETSAGGDESLRDLLREIATPTSLTAMVEESRLE